MLTACACRKVVQSQGISALSAGCPFDAQCAPPIPIPIPHPTSLSRSLFRYLSFFILQVQQNKAEGTMLWDWSFGEKGRTPFVVPAQVTFQSLGAVLRAYFPGLKDTDLEYCAAKFQVTSNTGSFSCRLLLPCRNGHLN